MLLVCLHLDGATIIISIANDEKLICARFDLKIRQIWISMRQTAKI